ncbi:MAG: 3-phosphoshikimate 1-carboxyvinyltransferase [Methylacidiphilales bacterium]|nr:3-phosphoshikimate 1-carboxyvinyltransferase [Candidatus Methylacidiphilales bacterium]
MANLKIHPVRRMDAEIQVPGDKSISHRSVMLSGFADGATRITGFLPSDDCLCSLAAMQALGVEIETIDPTTFLVHGNNGKFREPVEPIDCGNSGTTIRLLAGLLAGQPFTTRLFGDESLSRRPMKRVADPLELMGARVVCEGQNQRPPLEIRGGKLKSMTYQMPVASAQLKSCILLAALQARGRTIVEQPSVCRDHTERMLQHFGASIMPGDREIKLYGGVRLEARDVHVPGDFSSAAFWLVAAAAMPGAHLILPRVGLNPTRTALINVLLRMGAEIKEHVESNDFEPYGTLRIEEGTTLKGATIGGEEIPNLIDELPIIAVAGALAKGTTVIRDAKELRVKETDRLAALASNLRAFGVPVEEQPDGLIIQGGAPIHGARVESMGDHRIAMAFAILGLFAEGNSLICDTDCIKTSYPGFEKDLSHVLSGDVSSKFRFKLGLSRLMKRAASKKQTETVPVGDTKVGPPRGGQKKS